MTYTLLIVSEAMACLYPMILHRLLVVLEAMACLYLMILHSLLVVLEAMACLHLMILHLDTMTMNQSHANSTRRDPSFCRLGSRPMLEDVVVTLIQLLGRRYLRWLHSDPFH